MIRNKGKNLLCLFAGVIGFAALILTIGFFEGSKAATVEQSTRFLHYQNAYLSKEEKVEVPGSPLTLVKEKRPSLEGAMDALEGVENYSLHNDYSAFLPESMPYFLNQVREDSVCFTPIYDLSLSEGNASLLSKGETGDRDRFDSVLVNREFAALFDYDVLGARIQASNEIDITEGKTTQHLVLDYSFTIAGIVDEFSFMNEPRVYYSYRGLESFLSLSELEDGRTITRFLNEQSEDSPYFHYRYLVFAHDMENAALLHKKIDELEGTSFSLESEAHSIGVAFATLMEAFESPLLLVVGFSLTGLGAILAMVAFSSYSARKKEAAILISLGASRGEVARIFGYESAILCLFCSLIAMGSAFPLSDLANSLLAEKFGFSGIISIPWSSYWGIPFFLPVTIPLVALLFGFLLGTLPVYLSKRLCLAEELRDE